MMARGKILVVDDSPTDLAVMTTVAPPRRNRSAMAFPAPFVPPVTNARLPLNSSVADIGDIVLSFLII